MQCAADSNNRCAEDEALKSSSGMNEHHWEHVTTTSAERLRRMCLHLRKACESAAQSVNARTLTDCCSIANEEVESAGINMIKNKFSVTRQCRFFRKGEMPAFTAGQRINQSKLFGFFPDTKDNVIQHCNQHAKEGSLSVEDLDLATEMRTKMIPDCHREFLDAAGEDRNQMPDCNEVLGVLGLSSNVGVTTVWCWMTCLGCKCCENRKSCCSDSHEREYAVKDRNETFLIDHFKLERRSFRWMQVSKEKAEELERTMKDFPKNCQCECSVSNEDGNSTDHREHHFDTHSCLEDFVCTMLFLENSERNSIIKVLKQKYERRYRTSRLAIEGDPRYNRNYRNNPSLDSFSGGEQYK